MLNPISKDDARRMSVFLAEQGYTEAGLRQTLGLRELPAPRLRNLPRLTALTDEPNCLNTLVRWFWIGLPQASEAAAAHVPDWFLSSALDCGLLRQRNTELVATAMLFPLDKFVFVADLTNKLELSDSDLVLWPNPTSQILSRFTVRRHSRATLDLGTGSGVEAILAAAHSDTVVATDLNPRAVSFAAFSARLNGVDNVEALQGDGFAPVADRIFDLIVSNPPFFIRPAEQYLFCDNPLELDQLCHKLAREAPSHLSEGGYFQMLCEWAGVEGQSWQERVSEWFENSGCDALVFKGYSQDPAEYAEEHIRAVDGTTSADAQLFENYMSYYRRHKVEAIHGGGITMHRRSGRNWVRLEEVQHTPRDPFGDLIVEMFATQDFLLSHEKDSELLETRPRLSPSSRLEQVFQREDGGWKQVELTLRMPKGFNPYIGIRPVVAEFLAGCDGNRSLREVVASFSAKVDAPAQQVQQECLAAVRTLIERGFLVC
jgi:hypothetical protein